MIFVVIGLICNAPDICYWSKINGLASYTSLDACLKEAEDIKIVTTRYKIVTCLKEQ